MATSNYIAIDIGGKVRGWKVNQMTLEIWSKRTSLESENASSTYAAVYGGLVANCYAKSEDPDFTFENVCDWVDELNGTAAGLKMLELIKKQFEESSTYIAALERLEKQLKTLSKNVEPAKKKRLTK